MAERSPCSADGGDSVVVSSMLGSESGGLGLRFWMTFAEVGFSTYGRTKLQQPSSRARKALRGHRPPSTPGACKGQCVWLRLGVRGTACAGWAEPPDAPDGTESKGTVPGAGRRGNCTVRRIRGVE